MTLKEYRENTPLQEQRTFAEKLQTWLGAYTQEVYESVMAQMEDIINNETALHLIDELHARTMKERADEISTIQFSLGHEEDHKFLLHNHPLTHSNSYRDILHDMYIR